MRSINIEKLIGNEKLGKQVYDDYGRILLDEGVILTPFYIQKLKDRGIISVIIDDEISKDIVLEENISEKTKQLTKRAIKEMMDDYSKNGVANNAAVIKSVNSIIDEVLSNKDVMINVSDIRSVDDNIYSHSINVCVLSTLIGIHMGYNMLKLKDIAIGALLHDIGKTKIKTDKKVLEEKKTKEELNKYIEDMHSKVGFDFLGEQNICNAFSKVIVLMHHERIDGTGFPLKLKGNEISEYARLVSVCNTFDNLISGKSQDCSMPVYEALECLGVMSGTDLDEGMVKKFTMNIAAYPCGSGVKLNTNEKCIVARQNTCMPTRPVLKVLYDKNGEPVKEPYEIDLKIKLTLFITETFEV